MRRPGPSLAVLLATVFLMALGFGVIIPILAYYARDFSATPMQIGVLMAVYSVMQFFLCPLWGALSDRIGRRPVLVAGLAGTGLSFLFFAEAWSLPALYVARALSGAAAAAAMPTARAYVADMTDELGRGRGMGLMGAAIGLGFTLGPAAGGELSRFGNDVPFLAAGILALVTALFAAALLGEPARRREREAEAPLRPAAALAGPLGPFFVLSLAVSFSMAALETAFPLFLMDRLGLGAAAMGRMFAVLGVVLVIVQGGLLGRAIHRFGEEGVLLLGLLLNAGGLAMMAASHGFGAVTLALVVAGIGNQILRPTTASLMSKRTPYGQGATIGLVDSMDSLGRILGPLAAGSLYMFSVAATFEATAVVLLVVAAGLSALLARRRGEAAAEDE